MARGQCRSRNSNCQLAASQCVAPAARERQMARESERGPETDEDLYGSIAFSQEAEAAMLGAWHGITIT